MKNKFTSILILFILLGVISSTVVCYGDQKSRAQGIIEGILDYENAQDPQKWINEALSPKAGKEGEWYIIALRQLKGLDISSFTKNLKLYLDENEVSSPSTKLKFALCFAASGEKEFAKEILEETLSKQDLMSRIFTLHLMNNSIESEKLPLEDAKTKVLDMQIADGGWSLTQKNSDVDCTAMAIQALSPYYDSDDAVKAAIDKGLDLLSSMQLQSGGFKSYGVENPESSAQVLIALCALGIDAEKDERFIKNQKTVFDAIESFLLTDGSFSHSGGETNEIATEQVFCAMAAYLRYAENKSPFYIFETISPQIPQSSVEESRSPESSFKNAPKEVFTLSTRTIVVISSVFLGALILIILLIKRVKKPGAYVLLLSVAMILLLAFVLISDAPKKEAIGTVQLKVSCLEVAGLKEHIPKDGVILDIKDAALYENDSVFDILSTALMERKMHFQKDGLGNSVYVQAIENIYEFDFGELSGWTYTVNGVRPPMSSGNYIPKNGDVIEWIYTLDVADEF